MDEPRQENIGNKISGRAIFFAVGVLLIILLCASALVGYFYIEAQINKSVAIVSRADQVFEVKRGDGVDVISKNLEERGLIARRFFFKYAVWRDGIASSLKAGQYSLYAGMSPREIGRLIAEGKVWRDEVGVTIPEGFSAGEIDKKFKSAGLLSKEPVLLADLTISEFKKEYYFLADAPNGASLEGYFFPDTYNFEKNVATLSVAKKLLDNFNEKLNADLREEIARQNKTIFQIVTMASIIEKEVITEQDMKLVSGILWKRLALGMPLQVDATVAYGAGHNDLSLDDLKNDSPYNTYARKGLPKGPISNPGLRAISSAIYPTPSDYLYYLSKPNKETVFSKTLEEHNAAKNKYLR